MIRAARFLAALGVVALSVACSAGASAPPVAEVAEICGAEFCVGYPAGWEPAEVGVGFISFSHPDVPSAVATVGSVNMEAVVNNAGGSWPVAARDVVDHLWRLLDGGQAELLRVDLTPDRSYDSVGRIEGGRLWHRLVPITATRAWGVEMRAPNASWESHAAVFRQNLVLLETGA